jgi:hypothetical protein
MFDRRRFPLFANVLLVLCFVTYLLPAEAATGLPPTFEGLVKVPSKRLAGVYLLPGADFRAYTKVLIDPVQVSFRPGWQKDMNMSRRGTSRITDSQAQEIANAARSGFEQVFANAFKSRGYEIATAPAADVLRLSPKVVNLYLNAPDPMGSGATRTYTLEAGEASLSLEARDSTTEALLGVAVDRRATQNLGVTVTTGVTNRAAFEDMFRRWADACVKGLEELKARSPLQSSPPKKGK